MLKISFDRKNAKQREKLVNTKNNFNSFVEKLIVKFKVCYKTIENLKNIGEI